MRNARLSFAALFVWLLLACSQRALSEEHFQAVAPQLQYIERLSGGANATDTLPLLVALHGLGDTPEAFVELFADLNVKARIVVPRAPDPWGEGSSWYPIDDEAKKPGVIRARANEVVRLIDHVGKARPSRGKPVVSGFSQGGVLSFAIAALHSQHIAMAIPVAGSLPSELWPTANLPAGLEVVAFHGEDDRRILMADGRRTVDAFVKASGRASLRGFAGVGHAIPTEMRRELLATVEVALRAAHATPAAMTPGR